MAEDSMELPEFIETEEGSSLYYSNKWLYSRHRPVSRAVALVKSLPILEDCLYIVYSPCLWYGIPELLAELPATSAVLALEYDAALYEVARASMPPVIKTHIEQKRLSFAGQAPEALLFNLVSRMGKFRRVQEVMLSSGWTLAPEWYRSFPQKLLQYFSDYYRSRLTLTTMGRLWIRNTFKNLLLLPSQPAPFPCTSKPVLVCGAGLSLYSVLPFIKKERERFFILACDTAFGTLRDAGITPNSLVCLDAQFYNARDAIGFYETGVLSHAFLDISAHPVFYRNIFSSITPVITLWAQNSLLLRLQELAYNFITVPPYGSVGLTALALASLIAQKEIWIAGLDFAYISGWTHAPSTHIDRHETTRETRLYKRRLSFSMSFREGTVPVNKILRSDPALSMYHASCMELLKACSKTHRIVDMRGTHGLELGLPGSTIDKCDEAVLAAYQPASENAFHHTDESTMHTPDIADTMNHCERTTLFKNFLAHEYYAIHELRELLITGTDPKELRERLIGLDYLYIQFPDYERVLALELDALKRLALSCEYWMYFIEKICPDCKTS